MTPARGPFARPCQDCAFRPGSKELLAFVLLHAGPLNIKLAQIDAHFRHGAAEVPFFCHQGMPVGEDGGFVPSRGEGGVPVDANPCLGYRNVLEDHRADVDEGSWLLAAVRRTAELVRARILELRRAPRTREWDPAYYADLLDLLLDPGPSAARRKRAAECRVFLIEKNPLRGDQVEELAEVLTTGGPQSGLPSLVSLSATWMPLAPAAKEAP